MLVDNLEVSAKQGDLGFGERTTNTRNAQIKKIQNNTSRLTRKAPKLQARLENCMASLLHAVAQASQVSNPTCLYVPNLSQNLRTC
jgi:hypothetical protein